MLQKTQLAAAVGAALVAGATAVQAQQVTSGQPITVQLYGQVNRAVMHADNEASSKWFFVDGQPSSTRFGIEGKGSVMPGLTAGAKIETEIRSNQSNAVNFNSPATGGQTFTERWMEVYFEGAWGRVSTGQGSGAADGTMEVDLSGIDLALSNPMNDFGGGIPFSDSAGNVTAITMDSVQNNLDGLSRLDRLMYTSPVFGGFRAQVSVGQTTGSAPAFGAGEAKEASLWYSGKLFGDFAAAIGWADVNSGPNHTEHLGGSASWLHSSGINVSGAYGKRDLGSFGADRDAKHWNGQLGYKFGQHAIGVKYEQTEDLAQTDDKAKGTGIGYVFSPVRWADIYATYMIFKLDRTGADLNDVTVAAVGSRIRF